MSAKFYFISFAPYAIAALLGSIPMGLLLARAQGIDIRSQGSGNIGATNVTRVVNKATGMATLILDLLKGVVAVLFVPHLFPGASPATCGACVVIGHCYSIFLKGRGGKGVATSLGVFICLSPVNAILATSAFFIVFYYSHYVSLGLIAASLSMIALVSVQWFQGIIFEQEAIAAIVVALIVFIRHLSNIKRLIRGTELKFGTKPHSEP